MAVAFLSLPHPVWFRPQVPTKGASPSEVARLTERVRSPQPDANTLNQAFDVGKDLLREARWVEAANLFVALVEKLPNDSSILYGAALATFNSERVVEAEQLVHRAVTAAFAEKNTAANPSEINQRAADALVLQAVVLANRKDDNGALKSASQAVSLSPGSFDAQFALGRALFGTGDYTGAARAFQKAVSIKPADSKARFFLATALEKSADDAGALLAYRELTVRDPLSAEGHLGLGVLLVKRGRSSIEEGISELQRCLSINSNVYEARVTLGRVLVSKGRAADAIEHLRVAAELAPNNPEPHYQLSLAYRKLGKKDEAAAEAAIVKRIHESRRGTVQPNPSSTPGK